ncbi:MAG: hypothetical protein ACOY3O_05545 [Thermodesulfobacteriota bacterium]
MNGVRLLIAVVLLAGYAWLNWWVLPPLGMFHLGRDSSTDVIRGVSFFFWEDQKKMGPYPLSWLKTGWGLVPAVWPVFDVGLLLGLALGYPLGELARRYFAIDAANRKIREVCEAVAQDAYTKGRRADYEMYKARELYEEACRIEQKTYRERERLHVARKTVEAQLQGLEEVRERFASVQSELNKAKAKIRRLEGKGNPKKAIPIDFDPLSD